MQIGDRLRYWRKENKLSAQKIADKANVSQAMVSNYELNKSPIPSDFLLALYNAYQIDLLWLITGKERDAEDFTEEELQLIENFRMCDQYGKELIKINSRALSQANIDTNTVSKSNHDSPELSTSKTG